MKLDLLVSNVIHLLHCWILFSFFAISQVFPTLNNHQNWMANGKTNHNFRWFVHSMLVFICSKNTFCHLLCVRYHDMVWRTKSLSLALGVQKFSNILITEIITAGANMTCTMCFVCGWFFYEFYTYNIFKYILWK